MMPSLIAQIIQRRAGKCQLLVQPACVLAHLLYLFCTLQMVVACRVLAADPAADASITNVVFMGMGEPLHNYEAVMAAVDIMCQPLGLHMSHNKVRRCFSFPWLLCHMTA
jgi:hypothetical protein